MNVGTSRWPRLCALAAVSATTLFVLTSCQGSGPNPAANSGGASNSSNPRAVYHPAGSDVACAGADSAAYDADSISPADGGRGLQQLSHHACHHAGQRTGQQSRGGSRAEGKSGRADVVRGESGLLAAPHQLFEGEGLPTPWHKRPTPGPRTCTSIMRLRSRMWSRRSRPRCKPAAT